MATTDRRATTLALAHALSAAERGLAVIPLARTKLPALRSPHRHDPGPEPFTCHGECGRFGHGVHDASTDPARIRALFAAAPWATGYGIACGLPPHHLIGIDLDTRPGDTRSGDTRPGDAEPDSSTALRELALRHLFTIPPTVVVLTPSGGRHLWLTGPTDHVVPNSAGRLAPGIDVRGAGGYLVGPGSRTRHGAYTTAPGTAHLAPAPCPPALLRLLLPPPCGAVAADRRRAGRRRAGRFPTVRGQAARGQAVQWRAVWWRAVWWRAAGASSSSSSPRTRASATPASSGRPAAPTRTASARPC